MLKLHDFATQQGVTDRQVQRLLKKYEGELEGLYERRGVNGTWLSEEACAILRSKMRQAPVALPGSDPRIERLEDELREAKAAFQGLLEQSAKKDQVIQTLAEQNQILSLKADSVARLEADNALMAQKRAEAELLAREAQQELARQHDSYETEIRNRDRKIRVMEEYIKARQEFESLPALKKWFTKAPKVPGV